MKIKYLGHSAFLITSDAGVRIMTDPYAPNERIKLAAPSETADIVTMSHCHGDHSNIMAVKGNPLDSCYCTLGGTLRKGPVGFARFTTDDARGRIVGCIGDGEITEDKLETFGTTGVMKIAHLPKFLYFLAANGFEHHVALNYTPRSEVLYEALTRYMGWKIYHHNGEDRSLFEKW